MVQNSFHTKGYFNGQSAAALKDPSHIHQQKKEEREREPSSIIGQIVYSILSLMKWIIVIIIFLFSFYSSAIYAQVPNQGLNNNRLLGYLVPAGPSQQVREGLILNSYTGVELVDTISLPFEFYSNSTNISDTQGNLQIYTNGFKIANAQHQVIENGDSLTYFSNQAGTQGPFYWYPYGAPIPQTTLILPIPNNPNKYYIFENHLYDIPNTPSNSIWAYNLLMHKVEKNQIDSSYYVSIKNQIFLQDTLDVGMLSAVKHGNGRDWWVIIHKYPWVKYYKLLITPDTIYQSMGNFPGPPGYIDGGNIGFSKDGKLFGRVMQATWHARVYDFNRCTGEFSNLRRDTILSSYAHAGNAFSPRGKYFYFTETKKVWRYNLQASNFAASKELVYTHTGFTDPIFNLPSNYWTMDNPNDGRLYIIGSSSIHRQSWIDYPDTPNVANVGFHHYEYVLPRPNNGTNTYHPNYHLGADIGCPCDTLNLAVKQIDLSKGLGLKVFPNPADELFTISYEALKENLGSLYIYDIMGKEVHRQYLSPWSNTQHIDVSKLPPGVYGVRVFINGKTESTKVIVK